MAVAVLVAWIASRLRVPYTIAMVLAGLGVSVLHLSIGEFLQIELEPQIILLIFLPGLLFEASYHIDWSLLRENLRAILLLAIPGVVFSTAIVGGLLGWALDLPIAEALIFGVVISATDPIAVVALFKELGIDRRLGIIIEGESLFNDGVAIVGYSILVGIASGANAFSLSDTLVDFAVTVAGGATLGLVAGFLFAELMKRTQNPMIDIALTVILAYGVYFLAEEGLHGQVSPVIAVVVAGVVVGNFGARSRHAAASTGMIVTFWEFAAFSINTAVFLLLGLDVEISALLGNIGPVLLAIAVVLLARAVVIYLARPVINLKPPRLPMKWTHVMYWGGMRGAVSIALALSIPFTIGSRGLLASMVFGYVLFSVIVQGLTIRPLLSRLGLTRRGERQRRFEESLARVAAAQASFDTVERMCQEHLLSRSVASRLQGRFESWIDEHSLELFQMVAEEPRLAQANVQWMQRELRNAQRQALLRLRRRGSICEEVYADLMSEIDQAASREIPADWILAADLGEGLRDLPLPDLTEEE
jgi:CPA1 family monovalent cation:H+ antiporter